MTFPLAPEGLLSVASLLARVADMPSKAAISTGSLKYHLPRSRAETER